MNKVISTMVTIVLLGIASTAMASDFFSTQSTAAPATTTTTQDNIKSNAAYKQWQKQYQQLQKKYIQQYQLQPKDYGVQLPSSRRTGGLLPAR